MDKVKGKIPSNVKNMMTDNIKLVHEKTKIMQEKFMKFLNQNKVIVFILIVVLFLTLVSYRFTPKPREYIVMRNLVNHQTKQNLQSIYKLLGPEFVLRGTNGTRNSIKYGKISPIVGNTDNSLTVIQPMFTLSDFYIASSSKTYLLMNKYYDYCSYDAIKYTLDAGARFIELDIFRKGLNDDENIPVVTNGIELGEWKMCINTLCLKKCLDIVKTHGLETTTNPANENPLILYLNIHIGASIVVNEDDEDNTQITGETNGDYRFYNKIANLIHTIFSSGELLTSEYNWYTKQTSDNQHVASLQQTNIFKLRKKIIIMSNVCAYCSNLAEYINIICPSSFKNNKIYDGGLSSYTNGELEGLYDVKSLRIHNKTKLSHVYEHSKKNSLSNYVSGTAFSHGCQLISMYYQLGDNNIYSYLNTKWGQLGEEKNPKNLPELNVNFNNCSLILKKQGLRHKLTQSAAPKTTSTHATKSSSGSHTHSPGGGDHHHN